MKASKNFRNRSRVEGSRHCGATLYQKVEIFDILWPHSHTHAAIEVKFCTAKRTHVPVGPAEFDVNRCNQSPLRGEKPDFWPVSKNNTGSLPLRGILPVTRNKSIVPSRTMHTGRILSRAYAAIREWS